MDSLFLFLSFFLAFLIVLLVKFLFFKSPSHEKSDKSERSGNSAAEQPSTSNKKKTTKSKRKPESKLSENSKDSSVKSESTSKSATNTENQSSDRSALHQTPQPETFEQEYRRAYKNIKFDRLNKQSDTGNIQHHLDLINENTEELTSQIEYRIKEGLGEAIYEIGVQPDGTPSGISETDLLKSLEIIQEICKIIRATMTIIRVRDGATDGLFVGEVVIRQIAEGELFFEVRVAVVGNVDTGKSTLLGVLSHGVLDNGRGKARMKIFKHKHEMETGRTSDIGREILGFDSKGQVVHSGATRTRNWSEICENSSKVIVFMDLAGHEKYLKTTVFGLTGNYPDYSMMMIGANMGLIGMTKEHYHLTLALKVPCFFVVTKIDICPPNVLEQTLTVLKKMLKAQGSKKMPLDINTEDDVVLAARNFNSDRMAPIFQVSNVTGHNLDLLRMFLYLISPRKNWQQLKEEPTLFYVDNTFSVTGVGTVVSGTLMKGQISVNQTLLLGPNEFGKFTPVVIKGVHTNRLAVKGASAGQSVSLALKKTKRSSTRKGQVLIDPEYNPQAVWEFNADIFVITHSTTINTNYEAVIHCGCTRQTATIVEIEGVLRANHRGRVRFRYKYRPEFIQAGDRIIFREGKTKGIGNVAVIHQTSSERSKSRKEKKEELTLKHAKANNPST